MRFNQLKQYGTTIHEDTLTTSTPIAKMIPSPIDADYARLFLAAPLLYEALKALMRKTSQWTGTGKYQDLLLELVDIEASLAKADGK